MMTMEIQPQEQLVRVRSKREVLAPANPVRGEPAEEGGYVKGSEDEQTPREHPGFDLAPESTDGEPETGSDHSVEHSEESVEDELAKAGVETDHPE